MNKKELNKEMMEELKEKRALRREVIQAINDYRADKEATIRYYKLHDMTEKLESNNRLTLEEERALLRNYKVLDFIKPYRDYTEEEEKRGDDRAYDFIRQMIVTNQEYNGGSRGLENIIQADAIWLDEIIWDTNQIKLYLTLARRFGYNQIYYTNTSSGALKNITDLVSLGAKVVGTCNKTGDREKAGLILDISEVKVEE